MALRSSVYDLNTQIFEREYRIVYPFRRGIPPVERGAAKSVDVCAREQNNFYYT